MSFKPHAIGPVPEETARLARAAYPKGHISLQVRDEFGPIYEDEDFMTLYPRRGQPAEAPWRLALVRVMQCARGIIRSASCRCRAGAVGVEIFAGLDVEDPGFDASVLVEFRQRLLASKEECLLFDVFLTRVT